MSITRSARAHILLVLVTVVWGVTFVVIKDALGLITPLYFNFVRMTLASALLLVVFRKHLPTMNKSTVKAGALVGLFLWLGYEFQTTGLTYTTPSKSAFLTGVSVVLVPVFLTLLWRRRINHWTAAGVLSAFIGLFLLTIPATGGRLADFATINRGDLLTMACAISFAFQIIFLGRAAQTHSIAHLAFLQIAFAALFMGFTVPILEHPSATWNAQLWTAILVTGVLGTAAAFSIQAWAQQFTPATHTALIFSLEPVFAWMASYFALHERLGMRASIGASCILAGVITSEVKGSVASEQAD